MKMKYLVSILHYLLSHYMITDYFTDYSGLLNHALNEGYVIVKWTKLILSGAPATGKSSILRLLVGEDPPDNYHSTPVIKAPEVRKVEIAGLVAGEESASLSNKLWCKVDYESLKAMVVRTMKGGIKSRSIEREDVDNSLQEHKSDDDNFDDENKVGDSAIVTTPTKETSESTESTIPPSPAKKAVAEQLPTAPESDELYNTHWIYAIDSGGQAAFLDIAPALLHYNPVNILTLKLNEKLQDKPKFYFSIRGKQIGEPVERQMTHLQLLEASFRSLASVNPPNLRNIYIKISHKEPHFIVLGTYYDKIGECSESLDKKDAILWSTLDRFSEMRLDYREFREKVIFPINAIARGNDETKMANSIREMICDHYIEAEIPARWFLFQLDLDQLHKTSNTMIIGKSKCLEIGAALNMNMGDVEAALLYYHDLTIFLYFHKVLPDVVFLHPQPLFNKLSELISISFADAAEHLQSEGIHLPPHAHTQLKNKGIFEKGLLESCLSERFSAIFLVEDFLKLMEDVFIIASLPQTQSDKSMYFLPSVLPTVTLSESSIADVFKANTDPLILTWDMKSLPQGLFPALVVNLLSRKSSPQFDLESSSFDNPQYRNAIQLSCIGPGGAVLLVDAIYWLEIYYSGPSSKCCVIRHSVKEGIKAVVKKFQYKVTLSIPLECFHCTIHKINDHLCHLNEDQESMTCCNNRALMTDIDQLRQTPWLIEMTSSDNLIKGL